MFNLYKDGLDLESLRHYCMEHGEVRLFLTSSLTKYVFYNWLINNILYLCVT